MKLAGIRPGFAFGQALTRAVRLTAIAGLPLVGVVLGGRIYDALWALRHSPQAVQSMLASVQQLGTAGLLSLGFYSLVLIAVAEELAFRGYFHHRLRSALPGRLSLGRLRLTRGAVASGALFAAVHLTNWLWQPAPPLWLCLVIHAGQFVFGVVAAYLYDETGSLLPPILLHGVINVIDHFGVAALVLWLGR
ncbi:MAG: CPBP family intramembrane glutamic endopeptidase [Bacillota bacterium]